MSRLGICIVDSWLLFSRARGAATGLNQNDNYEDLAEQLIYKKFDTTGMLPWEDMDGALGEVESGMLLYGVGIHLTPKHKRRTGPSTKEGEHCSQRTFRVCRRPGTSWVCSESLESEGAEVFCCGPKTGRPCCDKHMREVPGLDV